MANNKITVNRGDTYARTINIKDADGVAIDATGWTIYFTVRKEVVDKSVSSDLDSLIYKQISGDASGSQSLVLTSSDTNINPGNYFYDIQIKKTDDTIASSVSETFVIAGDITRAS